VAPAPEARGIAFATGRTRVSRQRGRSTDEQPGDRSL